MQFESVVGILLLMISTIISVSMIGYLSIKGKRSTLLYSVIFLFFVLFTWSLGDVIDFFVVGEDTVRAVLAIQFFGISMLGFAWLQFSIFYLGYKWKEVRKRIILLSVPPIIIYLLLLTDPLHHLFYVVYTDDSFIPGPIFWINTLWSYTYLVYGMINMIRGGKKLSVNTSYHKVSLLLVVIIPLLFNILQISHVIYFPLDLTSVSFIITVSIVALNLFRYRFIDIVPLAKQTATTYMQEAVLILDFQNFIVEKNTSFREFFPWCQSENEGDLNCFIYQLKSYGVPDKDMESLVEILQDKEKIVGEGEIHIVREKTRVFKFQVRPVLDGKKRKIGRILTFTEITKFKELISELEFKNKELDDANVVLQNHLETVEELVIAKERNRVTRDMHDTLGHTMTVLMSLLEVCKILVPQEQEELSEKVDLSLEIARGGFAAVRKSIQGLGMVTKDYEQWLLNLKELAQDYRKSGMEVELDFPSHMMIYKDSVYEVLYRTCQESMTNALRHGKANKINLILKPLEHKLKLYILDNGKGCSNISLGMGLSGMKARIESVGGKVQMGSDGESGFNITAEIPNVREEQNDTSAVG